MPAAAPLAEVTFENTRAGLPADEEEKIAQKWCETEGHFSADELKGLAESMGVSSKGGAAAVSRRINQALRRMDMEDNGGYGEECIIS